MQFICSSGHQHTITWGSWKRQNARCNVCAQEVRNASTRKDFSEIKMAFVLEGYKVLSTEYKNQDTDLKYKCPKNHEFTTIWDYWQSGSRCPQCYLDGVNENIKITDEKAFVNWARLIKEKNNNKCILCSSEKNLHAHHLYSKDVYPDLRHDLKNGVTLCYWHHKGYKNSFHAVFGGGNNTKEQFEEYVQMYFAGTIP